MPRIRKLTWQPGSDKRINRWKIIYKGKAHYFPGGNGKSDEIAYQEAWEDWQRKKAEIDAKAPKPHQKEYLREIAQWESVLTWSQTNQDTEYATLAATKLTTLQRNLSLSLPPPVDKRDTFDGQFDRRVRDPGREKLYKRVAQIIESSRRSSEGDSQLPGFAEFSQATDKFMRQNVGDPNPGVSTVIVPPKNGFDAPDPLVVDREIWRDRMAVMSHKVETDQTIKAHVANFLASKQASALAREISAGRVEKLRAHLEEFQNWTGPARDVKDITSQLLADYKSKLLQDISKDTIKPPTASDKIGSVKTFVRWLFEMEMVESLPRVLAHNSKSLEISKPLVDIVLYEKSEIHELLNHSTRRTQLYLLLMLNCGMTQIDIADLIWSEVDWNNGRIKRKRSKTRKCKNVPVVDYKLWPETFEILKAERNTEGIGRVLLNTNGQPLVRDSNSDGKYKKCDNIRNAFDRLVSRSKFKKTLKSLKKTSASMLLSNKYYQGLEELFLCHAPRSVAERHYAKASPELLDEAIDWLRDEYCIADLELV